MVEIGLFLRCAGLPLDILAQFLSLWPCSRCCSSQRALINKATLDLNWYILITITSVADPERVRKLFTTPPPPPPPHPWSCYCAVLTNFRTADSITPRRPMSIRVTSITSSSATIQWMLTDPYNVSQPETFIVSYGVIPGQLNMSTLGVTASPTSQTYSTQLNSLQPGTEYFYRIESRNTHSTVLTQVSSFETIDSSK